MIKSRDRKATMYPTFTHKVEGNNNIYSVRAYLLMMSTEKLGNSCEKITTAMAVA